MKVYIYKENHWDYSDTLGVLSEAAKLRERNRLIEEAKKKRRRKSGTKKCLNASWKFSN